MFRNGVTSRWSDSSPMCVPNMRDPRLRKNCRFSRNLAPIRLLGDPVAIGRIVRNLIDNAIKYTDSGTVRVSTHLEFSHEAPRRGASRNGYRQRNSGRGDRPDLRGVLPARQPRPGPSRGVGLGLAIVQRLCELIGATVSVESVVGSGTAFRSACRPCPLSPISPNCPLPRLRKSRCRASVFTWSTMKSIF